MTNNLSAILEKNSPKYRILEDYPQTIQTIRTDKNTNQ